MIKHALEQRIVKEFDLQEVDTLSFYRTVFPSGCLEETGNMRPGKYKAIARAIMPDKKNHYFLCIHDDLKQLTDIRVDNATMNCASYIGKSPEGGYERDLYAFFIRVNTPSRQLDTEALLQGLQGYLEYGMLSKKSPEKVDGKYRWGYASDRTIPFIKPTFLVVDQEYMYFCFVMETPIPMFDNYQRKLQAICNDLSKKINQGLRLPVPEPQHILTERTVVGKHGCRAYRLPDGELHRISLDELNSCVAKAKYLHIRTIQEWTCKPALFEWFQREVHANVDNENLKPRVFVTTAAYAVKSGIDLKGLKAALDTMAEELAHRFSPKEIKEQITDAWYFYTYQAYWLRRRTRDYLSKECGFEIKGKPRKKGKEHKNRADHCRDINNDRKVEKDVLNWMAMHPGARRIDCACALNISPSTVTKWLNKVAEATQTQPKKPRKKSVCPVCGGKLKQAISCGVKFNKRTGKYRQRVSMVCVNPNCENHNKEVTRRYRTIESGFQEERSTGLVYTHVYGENEHEKAPSTPTAHELFNVASIADTDDDTGLPW